MKKRLAEREDASLTGAGEEERNDCAKPPQTGSKNGFPAEIEKDPYAQSLRLREALERSLRGWMVRDTHSEVAKALCNCAQNAIAHIEEAKIPPERLPVALRDPTTSDSVLRVQQKGRSW
jgi:hypothetical protein